jgi:hypothetical protein
LFISLPFSWQSRSSRLLCAANVLKEIVMPAIIGRKTQTVVCLVLSAVIVSVSLSLGAFAAEHTAHDRYSVTITQIQ